MRKENDMDALVMEFVGNNWLTISLSLVFLRGIARIIPGEWDDRLVEVLTSMTNVVRKNNKAALKKPGE